MRPAAPLLLLGLLLLAGCSSPNDPEPTSSAPTASDAADSGSPSPPAVAGDPMLPPRVDGRAFAECRQYHTAFPAQASDLQPLMPEGFTVRTDEAGLATLAVLATDCAAGADGPAAWLVVQVSANPPPQWADADGSHAVAIEAYVGEAALVAWLQQEAFGLAEPCTCTATTGPAAEPLTDGFTSDGAEDDYLMQTALTPDSGGFPAYKSYLYAAQDGKAVARLVETGSGSTNRGFGSVVLHYTGPGAAPTVFPGEVAHEIEGLALTWMVEPLV